MNRLSYNNFIQIIQHDKTTKHLESRVNVFCYCLPVIKQYTFHYLMKSAPIPGNHNSFEKLQLFDIRRYQSLVTLFFRSAVILI